MNKEKINTNMSTLDMLMVMSEGNPGALSVIMQMMQDKKPRGFLDILLLDSLDIRGSKIYMLWSDCSERNMEKYFRTLMMLRSGVFSEEQIQKNLNLTYALPFIDESINPNGTPNYGEEFGPTDEKWKEFCKVQKEAFIPKLEKKIAEEAERGKGRK